MKNLTVGVDISIVPYGRGVSNYIVHLLNAFKRMAPENDYKLFFNSFKSRSLPFDKRNFDIRKFRFPWRILDFFWSKFEYPPIELFLGNIDLFHSPAHTPVYAICPPAKRWVVTVHDLFTYKLDYSEKIKRKEWEILKRMEKHATHVIAVSNSTKKDLLELIPSLEPNVSVIHEGVNESFKVVKDYHLILDKYRISTPYIFYVGSAGLNKNVQRLVEAFHRIHENIEHKLILAGDMKWNYQSIRKWVERNGMEERIVFLGFVPDEDLPAIYTGADIFASPSLYEGFGLTVLEAMACGTPVIASKISSMPEVLGGCGLLCDPYDIEDISQCMLKLIRDEGLRDHLTKMGLQRASKFSWNSTAERTLEIYREMLQ
jgi:glycosyltransferase involved in cell wall biosynthesis